MSEAKHTPEGFMPMSEAPKGSQWIIALLPDGREVKAHYACNLSGEEQPPFKGYFVGPDNGPFVGVPDPIAWKPLAKAEGRAK